MYFIRQSLGGNRTPKLRQGYSSVCAPFLVLSLPAALLDTPSLDGHHVCAVGVSEGGKGLHSHPRGDSTGPGAEEPLCWRGWGAET